MSARESSAARAGAPPATFDAAKVRADFPILGRLVDGRPLVYLDSAATAQKPRPVLEALRRFYEEDCANVHRGVHTLSERATRAFEGARSRARRFLNAADVSEIIFVRGATEGINLVAQSYGRQNLRDGDEIVISAMEHHSNIVPWQMLCEEKGARLRVVPINDAGEFLIEDYEKLLGPRTRLVSVTHVSNALGTVNPVRQITEMAHRRGVPVLIDGAQAAPHLGLDVRAIGCDFYVFSGHKVFGPTGIGVLYGRRELLESMPPWQGGGEMIVSVTFEKTFYNKVPHKFEAGTPDIAGAVGLGAALDYISGFDPASLAAHERDLLDYATRQLSAIRGVRLIGTARDKAAVVSFVLDGVHPHDLGTILDQEGIAVRAGHHCAQPVMQRFGVPATARASLALYNNRQDIDALVRGMHKVVEVFG